MPSDGDDLITVLGALDRVDSHEVGVGVVVREMLETLGRRQFIETVDDALEWGRGQWGLGPGQRRLTPVIAIIDNRRALHRLPLFFETRDVELLLWQAPSLPTPPTTRRRSEPSTSSPPPSPRGSTPRCAFGRLEADHLVLESLHTGTTSISPYGTDYADDTKVVIAPATARAVIPSSYSARSVRR